MSGPSGAGKGTLSPLLCAARGFPLSVSATTRPPRQGEVDGKHYHFLSPKRFEEIVASQGFLEWAIVHGKHSYGTLRGETLASLRKHGKLLVEADIQGHRQIRRSKEPQIEVALKSVFIAPGSMDELRERILNRQPDMPADELSRRLSSAEAEMAARFEYDHVVVNRKGRLDKALCELCSITDLWLSGCAVSTA